MGVKHHTDNMMISNAPKTVEKPWGNELVFSPLTPNKSPLIKIMTIKPWRRNSLHKHSKKKESVHCLSGVGILEIISEHYPPNNPHILKPGITRFVSSGDLHRITAFDGELKVLEVSEGEIDENDIVRIEDDYGRAV